MNTGSTGIFIEPRGTLLDALRQRKARLSHDLPGSAFCGHPPHCTLLFGQYGSLADWFDKLRGNVGACPAFDLQTDAWQQFPSDPLAGGGHTVAYRVEPSSELLALQRVVAETVAPYRQPSTVAHLLADREPFASSLKQFGSPFVGPHWIPHFTIGSPRVPAYDPLLARLMTGSPLHTSEVPFISIWRVNADQHERLGELALNPSSR